MFLWKPLETVGNRLATVLETVCDFVETVDLVELELSILFSN